MGWKNPPKNFTKAVRGDIGKTTRRVANKVLRNLIVASPKDTGRFINNWLVGVGSRITRTLLGNDPSRTIARQRGERAIKRQNPFSTIFISNNLPYARRLNEGHSGQAPRNFVERAIKDAVK